MTDHPANPERQDNIDLRAVAAMLRRQMRIIAASFVLTGLGAALFLGLSKPQYTATALLLFDPAAAELMDPARKPAPGTGTENALVDTEVEILRSDAVAMAVIDRLGLATDPDFLPGPGRLRQLAEIVGAARAAGPERSIGDDELLGELRDRVTIRRRGLTHLIAVSASAARPDGAAHLANQMAASYIDAQVAARVRTALAGRDVLAAQIETARARLAGFERRIEAFTQKAGPRAEARAGLAAAIESNHAKIEKGLERQNIAARLKQDGDWQGLAELFGDDQLAMLARHRGFLDSGRPDRSLAAELARVDAALAAKAEGHLSTLSSELGALESKTADLRREMRTPDGTGSLTPERLAELYGLQQEAGAAADQYQQLLSRMQELEIRASVQVANSRIVSPAIAPARPSFPDPAFVGLVALALAAGLGVSLAFANEYLIGGITSEAQLSEILHAPAGAEIPVVSIANSGRLTPADIVIDAPLSVYAESLRKLRASIDQALHEMPAERRKAGRGQIVLVTSPLPAEGKSTTALALARTYALAGRRTLLIDADLRQPSIHRQLGFEPDCGFQDYLRDPANPDDMRAFYARDPSSRLAMILGKGDSPAATDQLLCSDAFSSIVTQARDVYDVTIIDSPPVLPLVDARYVAQYADLAVLLVKWAATGQAELRAAADSLGRAMRKDAALVPVLAQSRAASAVKGYGAYYDGAARYSAAT